MPGGLKLVEGLPVLRAEACFAIGHDGALAAEAVLDRRLRRGCVAEGRASLVAAVRAI